MKDIAEKYLSLGFNIVPVDDHKRPLVKEWTSLKTNKIVLDRQFDRAWGIAIFGGAISTNTEFIDIDSKYDLTGNLFEDYKKSIHDLDKNILKKLIVEESQNKGYHFIYRCSEIGGNTKLAKRFTIESEREKTYQDRLSEEIKKGTDEPTAKIEAIKARDNDKVRDLIETRGEGGYCVVYPSPSYKLLYHSFEEIQVITPQERIILLNCARAFNTYYTEPIIKPKYQKLVSDTTLPFEAYNQGGDIISVLESNGWTIARQKAHKLMMLRPGGTQNWSAEYDIDKKLFYVWTSSTEFTQEKAYNHSQVLTQLQFNGDYSASAKWLLENGFGEKRQATKKQPIQSSIVVEDDNFDFVAKREDTDGYIQSIRNGTFQMGLSTGFPKLDEYWRIKPASLVIVNGHDNVGKSFMMWYFAMMSVRLHNWNWIIYSAENKMGGIKKKIIEFMYCMEIKDFSDEKLDQAEKWFDEHFVIIKNKTEYNYLDIINMGKKLIAKKRYDCFLVDPFNALDPDDTSKHEFDYRTLSKFRLFIEQTGCGMYVNCHAITEAVRRVHPKDHQYAGYPCPPSKADTEGGAKFSNKADDFLTIHRMPQHQFDWMWTEIHVRKIKENETGGKQTYIDQPVKLRMIKGSVGFEDDEGFNPVTNIKKADFIQTKITPNKVHEKDEKDDYEIEDSPF